MFSISEINNHENNKNKLIEKSISLINEKFSNFNINQDIILVKKMQKVNIDSYTWLITYKKDIDYDFYIRIGNVQTEKDKVNEYYIEFIYNNELDIIIAYNILQSNTNINPYSAIEE